MIAYLAANWRQLAGAALASFALGYGLHRPPQPAVHLSDVAHYEDDLSQLVQVHKVEGPERVVVRRYAAPAAGCASGPVVEESTTERGPVTTDSASASTDHSTADRKIDLTITPQPRAGWELQVGLEDVLGPRTLRLAARRRLFGPFWMELSAVPATRSAGAAFAVEW